MWSKSEDIFLIIKINWKEKSMNYLLQPIVTLTEALIDVYELLSGSGSIQYGVCQVVDGIIIREVKMMQYLLSSVISYLISSQQGSFAFPAPNDSLTGTNSDNNIAQRTCKFKEYY